MPCQAFGRGVLILGVAVFSVPPALANQCGGIGDDPVREVVQQHDEGDYHLVVDWAVAGRVRELCPQDRLASPIFGGKKVYVWMRSAGNRAALERLRDEKRLPLKHVWARKSGPRWRVVDTISVTGTIISDVNIAGLSVEAAQRGFFDWRIYSNKSNLRRGQWKVTIIDRLGDRVDCQDTADKCEILFHVR